MNNTPETSQRYICYKLFVFLYSLFVEPHVSEAFLVEVRGVEPLSEKCLQRLSPSAVGVLTFPCRHAHRQAWRFGSS